MGNAARLSQHFLADENAAETIVSSLLAKRGEKVLEIGPGRGVLTGILLESGAAVTAVELDDRLSFNLGELYGARGLNLIHADFLQYDLERLGPGPYAVIANLPYAVGAPILQKLLPWTGWSRAVLMFQKEVALRLCSAPGGADFGLLTLSTLIWAEPEFLLEVPGTSFRPPPKVSSGVVSLKRRPKPLVAVERQPMFFRAAKAAFTHRRKMAAAVLASAFQRPRADIEAVFARLGVPASARPENIPFDAWIKLSEELIP
jgi:16S rRNA (adenine1518-N6/adenine1519-N6)-dimethyltransferase